MKALPFTMAALLVGALVFAGCTAQQQANTIKVSGAFALYPMMVKWAEEYNKVNPGVKIDVSAGGAGKGMTDALGGMVDIGMVSRDIMPEERTRGAHWVAVTKDAVVGIVSSRNPHLAELQEKGVTKQMLQGAYTTGTTKTWGEFLGTGSLDRLAAYTRSDSAGAAEMWARYLGKSKQDDLKGVGVNGDPGIANAVKDDQLSIGYSNLNFAYDLKTEKPNAGLEIVPLDLNGNGRIDQAEAIYATQSDLVKAVNDGIYPEPPARDLNLVTKGKFSGAAQKFVQWILTDGQKFVPEAGYVALPKDKIAEQLKKLG